MTRRFSGLLAMLGGIGIAGFLAGVWLERSGAFPGCILCHIERWILLGAGCLSLLTWVWRKTTLGRGLCLLTALIWLGGSGISFYHTGIQYRWFSVPAFCQVQGAEGHTLDEQLSSFMMQPTQSCEQRTMDIFSIPAAAYLGSMMLGAFIICLMAYRRFANDTSPPAFYTGG